MEPRDLPVTAALVALSATVALAFGRVFSGDRWLVPLLAAVVAPHAVALVSRLVRRGPWFEGIASAATLAVAVLVVTPGGPDPTAIADRIDTGWQALLRVDTVAFQPATGLIVLAAISVWIVAALADQLAFRQDATLGALAPGVVVIIWVTALGTHEGAWVTVGAFGAASVLFLALQHQRLLDRRRTWIGPSRRTIEAPRLLVVGLVAGVLALGLGIAGAVTLPDADQPIIDAGGLDQDAGARTYRTAIPPLLDVSAKLRQEDLVELFTVEAETGDYWRITALDEYRSDAGGQWSLTAEGDDAVGEGLDDTPSADALVQRYRIGPLGERWMPAAYRPASVSTPDTLVVNASTTLVTGRPSVEGMRYTVASDRPADSLDEVARRAEGRTAVPSELEQYTELPDDLPSIVAETAEEVAGGQPDPVARATALRDFFRSPSFVYDPNVALGDEEAAVETFLRDRRGFCVQFATTYALMARSLGIPARLAVGFTPGTQDAATSRFSVTNLDAHAWPELWFAGSGWTHVLDPTPPSGLPGGSDLPGEVAPEPLPAGTDPDQSTPTTQATVPAQPNPDASAPPATGAPQGGGGGVQIDADEPERAESSLWTWIIAAVLVAIIAAPFVTVLGMKRRRRARRRNDPDPTRALTGAWREALDTLTEHRVPASAAETPLEVAQRAPAAAGNDAGPPLRSLATAYTASRYAATPPSREGADAAWQDVDALRHALDASLGPWARLKTRLSPRTLRGDRERVSEPV